MGIQRFPNLLRWTVLACCLPYPGDPKSAIDCFFLFGISLHPGVTGSATTLDVSRLQSSLIPGPQELLRPASWLALLSRTFTFELAPTRVTLVLVSHFLAMRFHNVMLFTMYYRAIDRRYNLWYQLVGATRKRNFLSYKRNQHSTVAIRQVFHKSLWEYKLCQSCRPPGQFALSCFEKTF